MKRNWLLLSLWEWNNDAAVLSGVLNCFEWSMTTMDGGV
jgi:hypothetical protein